jgi:electron transport complex protein RnfD
MMAENYRGTFDKNRFEKPLINLVSSTAGRMWLVNLCAFLAVIQSSFSDSGSSLFIALSAVAAAVLTEFLILHKSGRAKAIKDGSAVTTALILALLLPDRISPSYAALGAVFAIAVIKHSFGGLGSNWLNPAAGGWLFVRLSWPSLFNRALEGSPLEPLGMEAGNFISAATSLDGTIRTFLNNTVFSLIKVELPEGYIDLFASPFPGIIADKGDLALLLGTVIISAFRVNRSGIPAIYLFVFGILTAFAGALPYGGEFWKGDVISAFCSGGTLVAAFFLASDPATGAKSNLYIALAAVAGGVIAFLFRFFGSEPYGVVFTAVLINATLPLIRILEKRRLYENKGLVNE